MKNLLKSRAGASIALALFYLIICTVLSLLIITIATIDSTKFEKHKETEKANLLVLSFFNSINDEIGEKEIEFEIISEAESLKALLKSQNIYMLNELLSQGYISVVETNEDYSNSFDISIDNNKIFCTFYMNSRDLSICIYINRVVIDDIEFENISSCKMNFSSNHIERNVSTFYSKINYDKGDLE